MFGLTLTGDVMIAVAAYVASIYTWPWLRTKLMGIESEIKVLEARIASLKSSILGK